MQRYWIPTVVTALILGCSSGQSVVGVMPRTCRTSSASGTPAVLRWAIEVRTREASLSVSGHTSCGSILGAVGLEDRAELLVDGVGMTAGALATGDGMGGMILAPCIQERGRHPCCARLRPRPRQGRLED